MRNEETKSKIELKFERNFLNGVQSEEDSSLYDYPPFTSYDINLSFDLSEISFDSPAKRDLTGNQTKDEENREKIFEVIYPKKKPVFTYTEDKSADEFLDSEISIHKRKRFKNRRRRRDNRDNIRKKIKTKN